MGWNARVPSTAAAHTRWAFDTYPVHSGVWALAEETTVRINSPARR
jgi:hypothetical protein